MKKFVALLFISAFTSAVVAEDRIAVLKVDVPYVNVFYQKFNYDSDGRELDSDVLAEGPLELSGNFIRLEATIDLNAKLSATYPDPAAAYFLGHQGSSLTLPIGNEGNKGNKGDKGDKGYRVITTPSGQIQTFERLEGSTFVDQINVISDLQPEEFLTIELPGGLPSLTVMAIDAQVFNRSLNDSPPLLNGIYLGEKKTNTFDFGAGRLDVGVGLIDWALDAEGDRICTEFGCQLDKILWINGGKDILSRDEDSDGVEDASDNCTNTASGDVVDGSGCSVQQSCECSSDIKNHGQLVSCTSSVAEIFVSEGLLTDAQKAEIVSEAAKSYCGKPSKGIKRKR